MSGSANMSQIESPKRYGLFALAILLLISGGAAFFLGLNNFAIRAVGLALGLASVYLIRISNFHTPPTVPVTTAQRSLSRAKNRPGRPMWTVGVVSFLLVGVSFVYLREDALHGYQEVLPVYLFTAAGLACVIVWLYLISKSL